MPASSKHALPTIRIRRAMPADTERVRNFVFAALRSFGFEPDPKGLDAPIVTFGTAGEDGLILEWVAEISDTVVGAISLSPTGEDMALSAFYVDAAYRGAGIGRTLLEYVIKEAKARSFHRLYLETSSRFRAAIHLYEATGWVRGPDLPPEYGPDRTYYLHLS